MRETRKETLRQKQREIESEQARKGQRDTGKDGEKNEKKTCE